MMCGGVCSGVVLGVSAAIIAPLPKRQMTEGANCGRERVFRYVGFLGSRPQEGVSRAHPRRAGAHNCEGGGNGRDRKRGWGRPRCERTEGLPGRFPAYLGALLAPPAVKRLEG